MPLPLKVHQLHLKLHCGAGGVAHTRRAVLTPGVGETWRRHHPANLRQQGRGRPSSGQTVNTFLHMPTHVKH